MAKTINECICCMCQKLSVVSAAIITLTEKVEAISSEVNLDDIKNTGVDTNNIVKDIQQNVSLLKTDVSEVKDALTCTCEDCTCES